MHDILFGNIAYLLSVVSGGIGVPLERRITSFLLPPAGVTLSTCDKRPPSLLASVFFILLVCHKPFAQITLVNWNCRLKGSSLLGCGWQWQGSVENQ